MSEQRFAAHFERGQLRFHAQRERANGAGVLGDVFAGLAVAARDGAQHLSVLVVHGHRQPVQLQFGDVFKRLALEQLADALVEGAHFIFVQRIVQAQHRRTVPDFHEAFAWFAADALGGRFGCDQIGLLGFQLLQPPHHPVILGVADLGPIQHVIQVLVVMQLFAQIFDFFCFFSFLLGIYYN